MKPCSPDATLEGKTPSYRTHSWNTSNLAYVVITFFLFRVFNLKKYTRFYCDRSIFKYKAGILEGHFYGLWRSSRLHVFFLLRSPPVNQSISVLINFVQVELRVFKPAFFFFFFRSSQSFLRHPVIIHRPYIKTSLCKCCDEDELQNGVDSVVSL